MSIFLCAASLASASPELLDSWHPGDGHVHSRFSRRDIVYLLRLGRPPSVSECARAAAEKGLAWLIVTDHGRMLNGRRAEDGSATNAWEELRAACRQAEIEVPGVLVLPGEELGSVNVLANSGHYLSYGIASYVDVGRRASCQEMIDATAAAGGFGVIAHPEGSGFPLVGPWFYNWDGWDAEGWAGVELLNKGKHTVYPRPGGKWDAHLTAEVGERMRGTHPKTTHVGVGSSDAHLSKDIGTAKTFVHLPGGVTAPALLEALRHGRCVASNGPLLVCALGDAQIGDTARVERNAEVVLTLAWRSDDPMTEITVIGTKGAVLHTLGRKQLGTRQGSVTVSLVFPGDGYVRVAGKAVSGRWPRKKTRRAFTNPIWIQTVPASQAAVAHDIVRAPAT